MVFDSVKLIFGLFQVKLMKILLKQLALLRSTSSLKFIYLSSILDLVRCLSVIAAASLLQFSTCFDSSTSFH